jgi:hypothetical protein
MLEFQAQGKLKLVFESIRKRHSLITIHLVM